VRRLLPPLVLLGTATASGVLAQAPPAASLWRVPTGSLAVPAPLQAGESGAFWNPAAAATATEIAVGALVVHTGSTLGLSGLIGAASVGLHGPVRAGVVVGRVQIRDLVRTTTSPDSRGGAIPVYEQFAGFTIAGTVGPVQLGTQLQLHESRFDFESETGFTLDFGVRAHPLPRLQLAASTHLLPLGFGSSDNTDYFVGAQYAVVDRRSEQDTRTRVFARYGITRLAEGSWEHVGSVGAELGQIVALDAGIASEAGYGAREWRPSLALALTFGQYTVSLAHGLGVNDVGGTFRVGLDMEF
jgi:hypothetical protein